MRSLFQLPSLQWYVILPYVCCEFVGYSRVLSKCARASKRIVYLWATELILNTQAQWTTPHAAAWSEEIEKYDGYVLLANEYNFGMSGATKNAIDYLYNAWIGKPILIVSYGIGGGTNASDQLKTVVSFVV
jgi:NAD(P)H-dependent FMN reductase